MRRQFRIARELLRQAPASEWLVPPMLCIIAATAIIASAILPT